ncbi:hypothetical protein DPX16_9747 [Anabarilius grahami]|uniref:Uncharacterized protein n=1 Tax=Anabarilius grahami TaxID=495550 RepID=A0A3N0Y3I6_ANAGA|nr:hypothetical protein DPX16_9747 [Anabarilius grahami]
MDSFWSVQLLCLEQKDRSLEAHLEDFIHLVPSTSFPHSCLCSFLYAGLNTATKALLSGEGPRGSFMDYVEWVLVSCDSPLTVNIIDDDTSPTNYLVPSQQHPDCEDRQPEPTAGNESHSAATPVFPPNLPHPLPLQHTLDSVFVLDLPLLQFLPQSPAIPVVPSSMPPISPSAPPLSGEATPRPLWESSRHGCEKPLAPPSASARSSPPRSDVPTPAPSLLPPSMPAETVGLSASQVSLSTSAPPGSGIATPTPRTYGPVATLQPSTPSSSARSSLPQAPPPPSVAPAHLQPSGSLPPTRGVVTTATSRPPRSSESLHYIGSLASRWASSLVSPSPPVVPMAAPMIFAPWLLPPAPSTSRTPSSPPF